VVFWRIEKSNLESICLKAVSYSIVKMQVLLVQLP